MSRPFRTGYVVFRLQEVWRPTEGDPDAVLPVYRRKRDALKVAGDTYQVKKIETHKPKQRRGKP
jgi:hypothetical protein